MIGISLCIFFSIFHIVLSQQIPQHCKEPPLGVENLSGCCKSVSIFTEEDFKACGMEKPEENEKRGEIPDCSRANCLMNRYSLMKDENTVDKEAVAAFLDEYGERNADFNEVLETVKEICLKDDLLGPPVACEANKMVFCISGPIFMICPTWKDTHNCKKVKNFFEDCQKYLI